MSYRATLICWESSWNSTLMPSKDSTNMSTLQKRYKCTLLYALKNLFFTDTKSKVHMWYCSLNCLACGSDFQLYFLWYGNFYSVDCWVDLLWSLFWWSLLAKLWGDTERSSEISCRQKKIRLDNNCMEQIFDLGFHSTRLKLRCVNKGRALLSPKWQFQYL